MEPLLEIRAGENAYETIKSGGFRLESIRVLAGASGGPKWLVLAGIDRVLPKLFQGRAEPLFTVGSSIGAWRFAALAQKDPEQAIERFQDAYLAQRYSQKPSAQEVTEKSYQILDSFLGPQGITDALEHPYLRTNIITSLSRGLCSLEHPLLLKIALAPAVLGNTINRRLLGLFFSRILFSDRRNRPPFADVAGFQTRVEPLTQNNLRDAILATGAIPLVMKGIKNIEGAPAGVYRDGGVIDYHLDLPFLPDNQGLVLYPHFFNKIIPGWFDKSLTWRHTKRNALKNTILICPSKELIESLPFRKIPDRKDFYTFLGRDDERIAYWQKVLRLSRAMGEELGSTLCSSKLLKLTQPF